MDTSSTSQSLLLAVAVAALWAVVGLAVTYWLQPRLTRVALLVLLSALAWPITLLGGRYLRSRFSAQGSAQGRADDA